MISEEHREVSVELQFIEVEQDESCRVPIRAATLEKLVEFCVDEFDENGPKTEEPVLSNAVFIAHQWFVDSEKLLEAFLDAYVLCTNMGESQEHTKMRRLALCQCVNFWMTRYGSEFRRNDELTMVARRLERLVDVDEDQSLKEIIDLSNVDFNDARHRAVSNAASQRAPSGRKVSLAFHDQFPEEIAEQLTYLEFRMLRRIPFLEWKEYALTSKLQDTSYLERYVSAFNGLSKWTQAMVLNHRSAEERANCIEKFQRVAKHLKELQNYNGLLAVAGGLTNCVLSRLHQTREYVSKDCKEYLNLSMEFLSSECNYGTYRKRLLCCSGFSIPVLGIQLKDLIATHTALPDKVNGNLINVHKLMTIAGVIAKFLVIQTTPPPVTPNMELLNMLRVSLQPRLSEDELYELSLAREPRALSMSPTSSLSRSDLGKRKNSNASILFADWASGTSSASDRRVLERHVEAMVEAVFRVYDADKDDCISGVEFDAIATNFPFIDPFGVIDVNCDGVITKDEMKNYFLKVNCQNLTREFSHNFQETTYFTPTFCDHCGGMLRGIIKQGCRCKECHVNCHKSCKKELVIECRNRSPTPMLNALDRTANKAEAFKKVRGKLKNKIKFSKQPSVESLKSPNGESVTVSADFYDRLLKAEESRDALLVENSSLAAQLEEADSKIEILQSHLDLLRQNTVTFILEQMDALQMQKVTEV